jgi:hypothetical protein
MSQNPQTPTYAKTIPKSGCSPQGFNKFYIPSWVDQIKPVEVTTTDPQLSVVDNSNQNKYSFDVAFLPYTPLSGQISIVAQQSSVPVAIPVLAGETVDEVILVWSYNNNVVSQDLVSDDVGITDPTLGFTERLYDYTSLSITADTIFTLDADDGDGQPESVLQLIASLLFGNYYYYGDGASLIGTSAAGVQAFLDGINKTIEADNTNSLFATGGEDEHFFFAFPKSYGLPTTIKKGFFEGGYARLANVGGNIKVFETGDSENDIFINNGNVSVAYYLYMSIIDDQNDPNQAVEIL